MIDRLKNCPHCAGVLNEAGRCEFCGSKVYDFLTIDFNEPNMPSAKTYIRLKVNGKIVIAPIIVDTLSATMNPPSMDYAINADTLEYVRTPCYPTLNIDFMIIGNVIQIDEAEES